MLFSLMCANIYLKITKERLIGQYNYQMADKEAFTPIHMRSNDKIYYYLDNSKWVRIRVGTPVIKMSIRVL